MKWHPGRGRPRFPRARRSPAIPTTLQPQEGIDDDGNRGNRTPVDRLLLGCLSRSFPYPGDRIMNGSVLRASNATGPGLLIESKRAANVRELIGRRREGFCGL